MSTIEIKRKTTSVRITDKLLSHLKGEAKRENRSLNNYIETLLFDASGYGPNKETINAMQELRAGKGSETSIEELANV